MPALHNRILAAGKATYVGDVNLPGVSHMAVVRSTYAHARIKEIDTSAAERLPGVIATVVGEEIRKNTNPIPTHSPALGEKRILLYALAVDKVRYVGEPIAAVVAEDRYTANQAARLIEVTYEELPPVVEPEKALAPGSALVVEDWGDNILSSRTQTHGNPDARLKAASGVVKGTISAQRYTGCSIEPRGYVALYDRYRSKLTLWASTQSPHSLRLFLSETLGLQERQIQVIEPHVGGAFGL
jgi:carbon-monoxide dehydrogenase large subunit